MSQPASASESTLSNPGFETGDLSGWTATGTAFNGSVTDQPGWGWGCCFNQQGTYHLWGFAGGGDAPTGTVTSEPFTLTGTGMVSVLVSGGRNDDQLYVALTTLDGTILHQATGTDDEAYRRVTTACRGLPGCHAGPRSAAAEPAPCGACSPVPPGQPCRRRCRTAA